MAGGVKSGTDAPGKPRESQPGTTDAAAASAARTAIDTILQSSTVELFHSQGVAVAPLRPCALGSQRRFYDWVGLIHFEAQNLSGVLTISTPMPVWSSREAGATTADSETL